MNKAQRGYIAGIIDGEGAICIEKKKGIPRIWIAQKDRHLLEQIKIIVNAGKIYSSDKSGFKKGVVHHNLSIHRKSDCLRILLAITPYLILKKSKAENAIRILQSF